MSHLLTSGQVGNIGLNHMKAIRLETQSKWDSLGFLDGLKGHVKENIAQLYENQASNLLSESTTATNSGSFETVVFPIVRRVFSKLLANDIVSVQAMNMPIGKLFFFVPQTSARNNGANGYGSNYSADDYNVNGAQYSAHTGLNGLNNGTPTGAALPDVVTLNGANLGITTMQAKNLYDAFYNDGLFDNSKGTMTIVAGGYQVVALGTNGTFSQVTGATPLATATDGSLRTVILAITGFQNNMTVGTTGIGGTNGREVMTGADGSQMDTESFLASLHVLSISPILDQDGNTIVAAGKEVPFRLVTQQYGKGIVTNSTPNGAISTTYLTDGTGTCYVALDLTHPVGSSNGTFATAQTSTYDGYVGASATAASAYTSAFTVAWARYATLELETEMGEVSFKLDEVVVSVEERKLRATWSPELAQDVSAFHNIDAEAELTAMLSEQVAAEIDREILRDIRKAAAWQLRWDYNGWRKASTSASPYTQKEWNQTLITRVNQLSAQIHKSTLRGGANFIVVSSEISAIFDDLEYFHVSDANPEQDQYNMGIERIGSLSGRYQVYRDPYSPAYSVIIGHKGKSLLDTGYIYAPYVPLQLTPTMYNPFNFAPVKGIMTRYAKKVVNNRFYGHVRVDGVPTFNINELR
jgi:Major capsid protein Gp23